MYNGDEHEVKAPNMCHKFLRNFTRRGTYN